MKVLVTDKINESAGKILESVAQVDFLPTMSEDELCGKIGQYQALMVRSQTKVTRKIIEAGKNLKIIGRAGVGVDNVDIEAATEHGIIVVNSPDGNTNAAAEHTVALMLAMSRNIVQAAVSTQQGKWERSKFTGTEVFGKTLGIIGLGKIGSHVAKVAIALGMTVLVYDPFTSKEIVEQIGAKYVKTLDEFWEKPDYISVHAPKTRETAHLINKDTIAKMKKNVKLINCARGGIIDETALSEAIVNKHVAYAAVDVFENEPNIENSPLVQLKEHILLTPHLGASTEEAQLNVAIDVAEQIKEVLSGGSARAAVNIPSLKPEILEPVKNYMNLAENIGEMAVQISDGSINSIDIEVSGDLTTLNTSPIEVAVLKGILSNLLEGVNFVNAPLLAKAKGIEITTSKSSAKSNYMGLITLKLKTDIQENIIAGARVAEGIKRIVKINDYNTSIKPEKHTLLVPHENKPAMIAKVATVIGDSSININRMQVAQKSGKADNISIMVITTESPVGNSTLDKIQAIDGVHGAKYIKLTT